MDKLFQFLAGSQEGGFGTHNESDVGLPVPTDFRKVGATGEKFVVK